MEYINFKNLPIQSVSHNPEIKKRTIINNGKVPHLTNYSQAIFTPKQKASIHNHSDMWEIFYVEYGEGIITVNDIEYSVKKGDCISIEPNEYHEIINNSNEELILNYFGIVV